MLLSGGKFHLGLSEREMSMVLDALDIAVAATSAARVAELEHPISFFEVEDFDQLRARFQGRFNY